MATCSVPDCKSSKRKTPSLSFHEFPSKEPRRSQWIEIINNRYETGNSWQPSDHSVICGLHFEPKDFRVNVKHYLLLPEAVPKIFKENSKQNNAKSSKRRRTHTRSVTASVTKLKSIKKTDKEEKENNDEQNTTTDENQRILSHAQQLLNPDPESVTRKDTSTTSVACQTEIISIKMLKRYHDELRQAKNTASCLMKKLEFLENEIKELIDEKSDLKVESL